MMVHDPVSALLNTTYEDSASFSIPRRNGDIAGSEIPVLQDSLPLKGTISIDGTKMVIKLYYDDAMKNPCDWNGKYDLKMP